MKFKIDVKFLPKGDWGLGVMLERERSWDNYLSGELILFKFRVWFGKSYFKG